MNEKFWISSKLKLEKKYLNIKERSLVKKNSAETAELIIWWGTKRAADWGYILKQHLTKSTFAFKT